MAPTSPDSALAGLIGAVIFGLTLPMTHFALAGFDVYAVGLGRAIPAVILAGIILMEMKQSIPPKRLWRPLAIVAAGLIRFPARQHNRWLSVLTPRVRTLP